MVSLFFLFVSYLHRAWLDLLFVSFSVFVFFFLCARKWICEWVNGRNGWGEGGWSIFPRHADRVTRHNSNFRYWCEDEEEEEKSEKKEKNTLPILCVMSKISCHFVLITALSSSDERTMSRFAANHLRHAHGAIEVGSLVIRFMFRRPEYSASLNLQLCQNFLTLTEEKFSCYFVVHD